MPLVPFPAPLPITDGASVAVWSQPAGLRVADDAVPLADARTLAPSPCAPGAVSGGTLALDCDGGGAVRLRDLATDAESIPPGADAIGADLSKNYTANNGYSFAVNGLGSRLVGIRFIGKGGVADLRYDLVSGKPIAPFVVPAANEVPDLDAADGFTRLCAPLRITTHRAIEDYSGEPFPERDTFAVRAGRLLLRHGGEMRLSHCGRSGFRVLGRSTTMQPVITRRYAAWATRTTVYVRGFRSDTTRAFPVRQVEGAPTPIAELRGTERRLWVQDAGGVRVLDL